jgi:hypothetical protein
VVINDLNKYKEIKYKEIIDCNAWYGINNLNSNLSVNIDSLKNYISLLKEISEIPGIFISSFYSLQYDPVEGDLHLEKILKSAKPNLFGNLIFPNYFILHEKDFEKYLCTKYRSGFRFLRLYPRFHKYSIDKWAFGHVLSILNKLRFPVMISLDELDITGNKTIDWKILFKISNRFKDIPLIIDGGNSKELMFSGYFYQLLKATENIYLETHNLLGFNQIEDIVGKVTPSKLILGSYFPFYHELLSVERIRLARISSEDKSKILYQNLSEILEKIKI